jgi:LCP family protein required for cell wall assembly
MGVDRVLDASPGSPEALNGRSDTLLLLRFNPSDHSVRMLSIPRDTRVNLPSVGYGKINDANVRGGAKLAMQVVSETLNQVPIDRYLRVTTDAFKRIVDLVGGVEVYVAQPMVYRDDTQKLDINLAMGLQTLNGDQAEQFARFRKDQFGDIGRVQRQQILLKALQQRLTHPTILPRIPEALNIMGEEVDTNLSLEEWLALANFGLGLSRENLKMVMLPGRFSRPEEFDSRSYWILSETGRDRVLASYFAEPSANPSSNPSTPAVPIPPRPLQHLRIAVQNATDNPDASQTLVAALQKAGFRSVFAIQDASQLIGQTEIVVQRGDLKAAQSLQASLGIGKVEADSTGDLDSDLTLRMGLDSQKINLEESLQKSSTLVP